jgi:hypothetical protein
MPQLMLTTKLTQEYHVVCDTKQLNSELQYGDAAEDRKLCLYFQQFVHQHTLPRFFKDLTVKSSSLLEAQSFTINVASILNCTT